MKNYQQNVRFYLTVIPRMMDGVNKEELVYSSYSDEDALHNAKVSFDALASSKVFEISPDITRLLLMTTNKVRPTMLPFPTVFIETTLNFKKGWTVDYAPHFLEQNYLGLLLIEGEPFESDKGLLDKTVFTEKYPNIIICAVTQDLPEPYGIGHIFVSLYCEYDFSQDKPLDKVWRAERDFLRNFVMNFLDFLNEPNIKLVEIKRSEKSREKRIRKRKIPLPPSTVITLTGKLKEYVNQVKTGRHFSYSHSFWVRGHWREFKSDWYKQKKGQRTWIYPYVKGEGLLIDKRYQLEEEEQK